MMVRLLPFTLVSALVISCHQIKKTEQVAVLAKETVSKKDSLVESEETTSKPPYRASVTRINDIIHTKLEVSFDWSASRLNGKATIQVKPYFYPVNTLFLDARGMDINEVDVYELATVKEKKKTSGRSTEETIPVWNRITSSSFTYGNDSIKINLGRTFTSLENYYVVINYVAKPNEIKNRGGNAITDDKGLYFINPKGENQFKMPQIWTQGETQSSSAWFPTIDSPNEKMTQEILMTVDDKYTTLSNGALIASTKKDGMRTDHWKLTQPHAPYLAMMAVGEFKKVNGPAWNGKEVSYYVEKEFEPHAAAIFGDTREMIDFYSKKLEVPYPWPKYSQIVVRDYVSGAMENTSATLHGDFMVYQTTRELLDGNKGEAVIAHELFHQWFGDLVTCESWSNLSLNESFATYGEYLWEEYKHGRDAADYHHWQSRQSYLHSDQEKKIVRYHYEQQDDMFDAFSYSKGGQILHMLRKAIGDDAFFAALKNYLETNKFKSAEMHHLRLAFEETTGQDLNWFFNQWFFNEGRPKIKVAQKYNEGVVEIHVEQLQDLKKYPLYTLPVDLDVYVNGKVERSRIKITDQKQTFSLTTSAEPQLVNFDSERQLLCDLEYVKNKNTYVFQYKNAPLYEDRLEALKALEANAGETEIFSLFSQAATSDQFYALRNYAISVLSKTKEDKSTDLKKTLLSIYENDKKNITRAKALEVLNKKFSADSDINTLNDKALLETSYAICAKALQYFTESNPTLALTKAKMFENEAGKEVLFSVANLYASHGGDEQLGFFHNAIGHFGGFEIISFASSYAKTAKRCENPANVLLAAHDLEMIAKGANKFTKFATTRGIKDLLSVWETKEKTAQTKFENAGKENGNVQDAEQELKTTRMVKATLTDIYNRTKQS
jgi:aminopeptidase N